MNTLEKSAIVDTFYETGKPILEYIGSGFNVHWNHIREEVVKDPKARVLALLARLSSHLPKCESWVNPRHDVLPVIRAVFADFQPREERGHLVVRAVEKDYHFYPLRLATLDRVICAISAHWQQKIETIASMNIVSYHNDGNESSIGSFVLEEHHVDALRPYAKGDWTMPIDEKIYPVVFTGTLWLQLALPSKNFFVMCDALAKYFGILFVGLRDYRQWKSVAMANPALNVAFVSRMDEGIDKILISSEMIEGRAWTALSLVGKFAGTVDKDLITVEAWSNQFIANLFCEPAPAGLYMSAFRVSTIAPRIVSLLKEMIISNQGVCVIDTEGVGTEVTTWAIYEYATSTMHDGVGTMSLGELVSELDLGERPVLVKGYSKEYAVYEFLGLDPHVSTRNGLWRGLIDIDLIVGPQWTKETGRHDARHGVTQKVSILNSKLFGTVHSGEWASPSVVNDISRLPRPKISFKELYEYVPARPTKCHVEISVNGVVLDEFHGPLPLARLYYVPATKPASEVQSERQETTALGLDLSIFSARSSTSSTSMAQPLLVDVPFSEVAMTPVVGPPLVQPIVQRPSGWPSDFPASFAHDTQNMPQRPSFTAPSAQLGRAWPEGVKPPFPAAGPMADLLGPMIVVQGTQSRTVERFERVTTSSSFKLASPEYLHGVLSATDPFCDMIIEVVKQNPGISSPDIVKMMRKLYRSEPFENKHVHQTLHGGKAAGWFKVHETNKYKYWAIERDPRQ